MTPRVAYSSSSSFPIRRPPLRVWTGKTGKEPHEHWSKCMFWTGKVAVRTAKAPVRIDTLLFPSKIADKAAVVIRGSWHGESPLTTRTAAKSGLRAEQLNSLARVEVQAEISSAISAK